MSELERRIFEERQRLTAEMNERSKWSKSHSTALAPLLHILGGDLPSLFGKYFP
jgi:hypothetical protein